MFDLHNMFDLHSFVLIQASLPHKVVLEDMMTR